jgi:hypothetical protein
VLKFEVRRNNKRRKLVLGLIWTKKKHTKAESQPNSNGNKTLNPSLTHCHKLKITATSNYKISFPCLESGAKPPNFQGRVEWSRVVKVWLKSPKPPDMESAFRVEM